MNPTLHRPPRHFTGPPPAASTLPEPGLPQDRHARIAARRSFVALKQQFMSAVARLDGLRGDWLRHQVHQCHQPGDLWLLRGAVFAALGPHDETTRRIREELGRVLGSVFPDDGGLRPFGSHR